MSYSNGPKIVNDQLVCYFDSGNTKSYSGTGTSGFDLSGYNNTITLQNSPIYSGNLYFNGTNQRIAINPTASTIRNYNSTTMFTVTLPTWGGSQRCILSYRGSGGGSMYIGKQSNGVFVYYDSLSPSAAYTVGNLPSSTATALVHILSDATNQLLSVYINGSLTGSVSRTAGWVSNYCSSVFYLGYDNGGTAEYMLGNFYNFAHYNKVLSASEIIQNFNAIKGRFNL